MNRIGKNGVVYSSNFSEVGPVDNLIAYWPLDGHLQDYSNYDSTLTNSGASVATGVNGKQCYNFSSGDEMYVLAADFAPAITTKISVSMWINQTSASGYDTLLHGNTTGAWTSAFWLATNGTTEMRWSVDNNSSTYDFVHGMTLGTWNHVAATYDGTLGAGENHSKVYINGVSKYEFINNKGTINSLSGVNIGKDGVASYPYIGSIQDVRIYNDVLTPAEIEILANRFDSNVSDGARSQLANTAWYTFGEFKE